MDIVLSACTDVLFNGIAIDKVIYNGNEVWPNSTPPTPPTPIGDYDVLLELTDGTTSSVTFDDGIIDAAGVLSFNNSYSSATIGDGITTIDMYAFQRAGALVELTIGSGMTRLGLQSLYNCTALTTITCYAVTPPNVGDYSFMGDPIEAIYVPAESVNAYKSANGWSDFSSVIQAIP